jgi:hypothetical protein
MAPVQQSVMFVISVSPKDVGSLFKDTLMRLRDERRKMPEVTQQAKDAKNQKASETTFIVDSAGGEEAADLRAYLQGAYGKGAVYVVADDMFTLRRALQEHTPSLVIIGSALRAEGSVDSYVPMREVMKLMIEHNPDVNFIIASDDVPALSRDDFAGLKVIGMAGKPFHARRVRALIKSNVSTRIGREQTRLPGSSL